MTGGSVHLHFLTPRVSTQVWREPVFGWRPTRGCRAWDPRRPALRGHLKVDATPTAWDVHLKVDTTPTAGDVHLKVDATPGFVAAGFSRPRTSSQS